MKIVKAIAKRILRKELKIQREINQELCQNLKEANKSVKYYRVKYEYYKNKQKLNTASQEIADIISKFPSLQIYYDIVAKELGCKVEEIAYLSVHPNYSTSDFCIGTVVRIIYNGTTFIAERNNSPCIIYANTKNV